MNELVNRNTALPANFGETLMRGIADTRSTMSTGNDGSKPLLRLLTDGHWVFGQANEPVEKGSQWAVNIASLSRGWVCWAPGELLGQVMASVQVEMPARPEPVDDIPFKEQFGMELTCVSGAHDGELVVYKNNSDGFKQAFQKLLGEIQQRWAMDKQYYWPVVELHETSYQSKKYGLKWKPLLPVMAWTDEEGNYSPDSEVAEAPEPVAAPKQNRKRDYAASAPEPAQPPLPSAQTHTGQRRRPIAR